MFPYRRLLFASLFSLTALSCAAVGQASRIPSTIDRRIDTIDRQAKDFERDNMGRDSKPKSDGEAAKRSRRIRLEIEEDLNFLQEVYNSTVTILQTGTELRPDFAAGTGRAVRKHALRLKTNLALPDPDEKDAKAPQPDLPETERKVLTAMCRTVYELIANPMFENSGRLDAESGAKARSNLDAIIRMAEHLSGGHRESEK